MKFLNKYGMILFLVMFVFISSLDAQSITIYKRKNYKGKSVVLTGDTPSLLAAGIDMNDKVKSLKLTGANSVAVYEHLNYKGKCRKFTSSVVNLAVHEVGSLGISSIKINADCPQRKGGIILYDKKNYKGESLRITSNKTYLPSFEVKSVKLDGVSSAALFMKSNYEGNCQVFSSDQPNFNKTDMLNNEVSSVKLNGNCRHNGPYMFIFEGKNYSGRRFRLTGNAANMDNRYWGQMKNKVSSLKMYNMSSAALYQDEDYNGKCYTMKANIPDMSTTRVKNNKLSSIKMSSACAENNSLKMRNNSAAVVKFAWQKKEYAGTPTGYETKRLAAGREVIMNFDPLTELEVTVFFIYPSMETADNFQNIKEKCSYSIKMDKNHMIFAKGTLINPACDHVEVMAP